MAKTILNLLLNELFPFVLALAMLGFVEIIYNILKILKEEWSNRCKE